MTAGRVVLVVGACWIGASILGALVGWIIGQVAPGFVTGLFQDSRYLGRPGMPTVEPVSTGIGLGIVNGGIAGIVLGVLAVLVEAFGKKR